MDDPCADKDKRWHIKHWTLEWGFVVAAFILFFTFLAFYKEWFKPEVIQVVNVIPPGAPIPQQLPPQVVSKPQPEVVYTPPTQVANRPGGTEPAPPSQVMVPLDPYADFSAGAQQMVADIAQQDEKQFARIFSVKCISASQSRRKFNGYGINTDMVVVSAHFRLSQISAPTWFRNYNVSETIDAQQFLGLGDVDTVNRIVDDLKEQITADSAACTFLQKAFNNETPN
jgi:hypothetical protein